VRALIVMPQTAPRIKVEAVERLGAEVVLAGEDYDGAKARADTLAAERGMIFVPPFDDEHVIAGQGTVAMEIVRQHGDPLDAIFVEVGGGGLIAGISAYVKALWPHTRIIGVEPYETPTLYSALAAGRRVTLEQVGRFADGVAVRQIGAEPFRIARECVDDVLLVTTDEICAAIKDIFEDTRSIAAPAGALPVAGLKRYVEREGITDGGRFAATRPRSSDAVTFLIETVERHPDQVTLVALGPMTNLALALRRRPDLAPRVRRLVFMGGNARVPGNVTPAAEFNFWFDPEAADAVLAAPIPRVVMFGLDITNHAPLHKTLFDRIVAVDTPLTRLMRHDMGSRFEGNPAATSYVWDCITAAWLIEPSIVTASERLPIKVDTTFGPTYGATLVDAGESGETGRRVQVMLDLDVEPFYALYADLLARGTGD